MVIDDDNCTVLEGGEAIGVYEVSPRSNWYKGLNRVAFRSSTGNRKNKGSIAEPTNIDPSIRGVHSTENNDKHNI